MEAVHVEPLLASLKAVLNTIPQNGGLCIDLERVDDNHSIVILKIVLYKYKDSLEKWIRTLVPRGNNICWLWHSRDMKILRQINNDQIKSFLGIHNTIVPTASRPLMLHRWKSNTATFRFISSKVV
jgi:hypothetical protein